MIKLIWIGFEKTLPYEGEFVEIIFRALMGRGTRRGRLEIEDGWAYLYKKGRGGTNYESAFALDRVEKDIIEINKIDGWKEI